MPDATKITLSPQERQLITNSEWILTKRGVIDKAGEMMSRLSLRWRPILEAEEFGLPVSVYSAGPKISRGENYRLLPYVILDYPRCFSATDVFAVRTLFWWGNFFSLTLHLGGQYKTAYEALLLSRLDALKALDAYICIHDDPWQHHFERDNYLPVKEMDSAMQEQVFRSKDFLKLAVRFPLEQWDEMPDLLEQAFTAILRSLRP